jgi:hypothetical protein
MVLNLSQSGLFVQTTVAAKPGEDVELLLNAPQTRIAIPVNAQIVWNRVVNPQFRSVVQGGFGARIRAASDDYYELLRDYAPFDDGGSRQPTFVSTRPALAIETELTNDRFRYRVHVKLEGKPRSRFVTVTAASKKEAEKEALARVGRGWTVLAGPILETPSDS